MNLVIRTNSNGKLYFNTESNEFCIEFGNVYFTLSEDSFELLKKQLLNMSNDLSMYQPSFRIMVPVSGTSIVLMLTPDELLSIKNLVGIYAHEKTSFKLKINYSMN